MNLLESIRSWFSPKEYLPSDTKEDLVSALMQVPEIREALSPADAALALDDVGWITVANQRNFSDLDPRRRALLVNEARLYWMRDPLAHQAVRLWTDYAFFDQGMSFQTEDGGAQDTLDKFMNAQLNNELTSPAGQQQLSKKLLIDGEVFFALFVGPNDSYELRTLDPLQITDLITDPDDEGHVLAYRRETRKEDGTIGKVLFYGDYRLGENPQAALKGAKDPQGQTEITLEKDVVVYHLKFDSIGKRGNSLLMCVVDWSREHRRFMEARVALTQSLAKFAWKLTAKIGQKGIDAIKNKLQSSLTSSTVTGIERNPPASAGSTYIGNTAADMAPMPRATGAGDAMSDGRMLKLMFCAGVGIMEHYMGDGANANLAVACYSEDTEYLSVDGWKKYTDFNGEKIAAYDGDTGRIHYEEPKALHVYPYNGLLTHFHGRGTDCLVTPNHRMWTRLTSDNATFQFLCADGLSNQNQRFSFVNRSTLETNNTPDNFILGDHQWDSKDAARFLGLFISEGSTYKQQSRNYVIEFGQNSDSPFTADIEELLSRLFERSVRKADWKNLSKWIISDVELYGWLREHCGHGAGTKRFPSIVWEMSLEDKTELFNWLMKGDGHRDARSLNCKSGFYSTSSIDLLNDFQRLCCEIGISCHTRLSRQKPGCLPEYMAQLRFDCDTIELDPERNSSEIAYEGEVWCFETSTGIFVTRRNGRISWQGNTAMELPMLKQFGGYQQLWKDAWRKIFGIVLQEKPEDDPIRIDISLPEIVSNDLRYYGVYIQAVTTIFPESKVPSVLKTLLSAIKVENLDEVMDEIEQNKIELDKKAEELQKQMLAAQPAAVPGAPPNGAPKPAFPPSMKPGVPVIHSDAEAIAALDRLTKVLSESPTHRSIPMPQEPYQLAITVEAK